MADRSGGVPGWRYPSESQRVPGPPRRRDAPYVRAIGWAIMVWVVTVGITYAVAQVLGAQQLGGWIGFAGFLASYWIGGTRAGITGRAEWLSFVIALTAVAFLALGFAGCVAAMAMYG